MIIESTDTRVSQNYFDQREVLEDYRLAYLSRQVSRVGRREVLSGKAKFGIFGAGKELPQLALAKVFEPGDFRSGYYRDQTLMFALGIVSPQQFFAQLYAHADLEADPSSAGRSMTAHFASRLLNLDGSWRSQVETYNTAADLSPTGSQMPKLVGLGYASRLYRELKELSHLVEFSRNGDEVAFGTVGNATCAEGVFWESINAIGVLQCPVIVSIWDDGFGISVPNEFQVPKGNISELLKGFQRRSDADNGFNIYTVKGWDYPSLIITYRRAVEAARGKHQPAIIHVVEVTQPQGHSTSGSHERYKSQARLDWEKEFDGISRMRQWILDRSIASAAELDRLEQETGQYVEQVRVQAWEAFMGPIRQEAKQAGDIMEKGCADSTQAAPLQELRQALIRKPVIFRRDILSSLQEALILLRDGENPCRRELIALRNKLLAEGSERYDSHVYSQSSERATEIEAVSPVYTEDSPLVPGFEILNRAFDELLQREPRFIAFGEDVGKLGDVNQGFAGLQEKYGPLRVSDTGIREATIIGQAIGMALRGLRPLAEIQYLDYLLYALQIIADDLATLHWRTKGGQKAPVIIRTRGHRLEGIWHSGSPMAAVIHLLRGVHVLVPRDMTQAAGFYNALILSDEPGLVVEVLNGYRLRERLPANLDKVTIPIGVPEVIKGGDDITLVTYGALCRITLEAALRLNQVGISAEVIDVRSLLPFDINRLILGSLKKTGRIIFIDEDVPGGTTAYMMQEVIEKQGGFWWLDSEPRTLSAKQHRPAYGSDGDYWSKPNAEEIFDLAYVVMNEVDPTNYPDLYE